MLRNEWKTLFRRRRTIGSLVALGLVPVIISIAVQLSHSPPSPGEGPPFLDQVTGNGFFAALTGLALVTSLLLPLTVAIVSGDAIAGEANLGTLRYLLIRPISRTRLLIVKYIATLTFTLAATLIVVVAGLIAGSIIFGTGKVVTLSGVQIGLGEALIRAMFAAAIVTLFMSGLAAIGLFISTITEQPVGAMVTTLGAAIVSQIVDSIPQLHAIHTALFTHYWQSFVDVFRVPATYGTIEKGLLIQLAWAVIFGTAAWARLTSKDVLA